MIFVVDIEHMESKRWQIVWPFSSFPVSCCDVSFAWLLRDSLELGVALKGADQIQANTAGSLATWHMLTFCNKTLWLLLDTYVDL
jgi:hypothetical protein